MPYNDKKKRKKMDALRVECYVRKLCHNVKVENTNSKWCRPPVILYILIQTKYVVITK